MGPEWQLPLASIDERMLAFQEEAHILHGVGNEGTAG
jgi:hypothetical protein